MSPHIFLNTQKIISAKQDSWDYLFHFTKGPDAFFTFDTIVGEKRLISSKELTYICFTETPLSLLPSMFEYFDQFNDSKYAKGPKFAPYGIGFRKSYLFAQGARPVIYSKPDEIDLLDDTIKWRHENFYPLNHKYKSEGPEYRDYSWMREWRLPTREFKFSNEDCILFTKESVEQFCYQEANYEPWDGDIENLPNIEYTRYFKHISLEDIESYNSKISKQKILNIINSQMIGEKIED